MKGYRRYRQAIYVSVALEDTSCQCAGINTVKKKKVLQVSSTVFNHVAPCCVSTLNW